MRGPGQRLLTSITCLWGITWRALLRVIRRRRRGAKIITHSSPRAALSIQRPSYRGAELSISQEFANTLWQREPCLGHALTGLNKKLLSPEGFSNQPKRYFGLDTTTLEQTETYDIKGNLYILLLWGLFVVEMTIIGCGQTLLFWNVPTLPFNLVPSSHQTKVTFDANHQNFLHPPF